MVMELEVWPDQRQAFDRWVVPELRLLLHVARTLTPSEADAEDLVQEVLLRSFRSIDRFDGRHPRAWLLTILRNAAVNRARLRTPEPVSDPPPMAVVDDGDGVDAPVREALDRLPAAQRALVTLVYLDGLSYEEAALALGVPVGTVRSRLHRATRRMRRDVQEQLDR